MAHYPNLNFLAPQLPYYPLESHNFLKTLTKNIDSNTCAVIASSMGAYLLSSIEDQFQPLSCLINPAVKITENFKSYLGDNIHPYTKETFTLTEKHLDELLKLEREKCLFPEKNLVLLKTGDEVLNFQLAINKYDGAEICVDVGGDHSFSDFPERLDFIFNWLCSKDRP